MAAFRLLGLSACCLAGAILCTSGCASNNLDSPNLAAAPGTATGFASGSWLSRVWNPQPERPLPPEAVFDDSRELKNPERLHLTYARWQEDLGKHAQARKSYEQVLASNARNVDALLGMARIDQATGRTQQAEQGFQKAVQLSPGEARPLAALGEFYASQKRWKEAIAELQSAAALAPSEPAYQHHLATAVARSGDFAAAIPLYAKAVGEAEAYYNVGCILYEQGRPEVAERYFHQALSKRPDLDAARKMLAQVQGHGTTPQQHANAQPIAPANGLPAISAKTEAAPPVVRAKAAQPAGAVVQHFVVPVEYRIEEASEVAGWNPTRKRPAGAAAAPEGLTPEQREQWANQARPAGK